MKFSIRDLLLVTVIVVLAAGWWVDRSRLASELKRLTKKPSLIDEINRSFEEEEKKGLP
ncbi:MAG: hypothetical protein ACR2FY_17895 [Pirellulaceae bacterium]